MSRKILVIDDDHFVPKIVMLCLASANQFVILSARDGSQGLAMALQERPDLIFLDFDLPSLDGLAVLLELRRSPAVRAVPIVAITGMLAHHSRCAEFVAESDAYLPKPLDFDGLRRTVRQLTHQPVNARA
ncbi:MAG: response regulator [Anaerolineales bacterium]|nr:response regulator [Anaerolineales bacterium]